MTGALLVVFPGQTKTRTRRGRRTVAVAFDAEFMRVYREACAADKAHADKPKAVIA